jgi:5-(aminomethyl)-3-furanmethanol phosphate kinase
MLGMHQMAEAYFKLQPRLAPADSIEGIARILALGQIPVWLPLQMCQDDAEIPADWSITSDGLAARLAERMGGLPLVLLKSIEVDATEAAGQLAEGGVVDQAFPGIIARSNLDWRILGPSQTQHLRALLGLGEDTSGKS